MTVRAHLHCGSCLRVLSAVSVTDLALHLVVCASCGLTTCDECAAPHAVACRERTGQHLAGRPGLVLL